MLQPSERDYAGMKQPGQFVVYFWIYSMIYSGFEGRYWVEMSDSLVEKLNFQALIKLAARAASPTAWGGCAGSRLDHGLKV